MRDATMGPWRPNTRKIILRVVKTAFLKSLWDIRLLLRSAKTVKRFRPQVCLAQLSAASIGARSWWSLVSCLHPMDNDFPIHVLCDTLQNKTI